MKFASENLGPCEKDNLLSKNFTIIKQAMPSTPAILATCKQTRFHLLDDNPSKEVRVAKQMFHMITKIEI